MTTRRRSHLQTTLLPLLLASLFAGQANAQDGEADAAKMSGACREALKTTQAPYEAAVAAKRWAAVDGILQAAALACRGEPLVLAMVDTFRALSAYSAGDDQRTVAILHERGVDDTSTFYLHARLVEAAALRRSGDEGRYRAIRDELIEASARGLTGGDEPFMRKAETLDTPYAKVDVFEEIPRGRGLREIFLMSTPKNGAMPVSVTYSFKMDDKGRQAAALGHMDMTWCDGNALMANDKAATTEADLNTQAARALGQAPDPSPATASNGAPAGPDDSFSANLCPQAQFIFRGIATP